MEDRAGLTDDVRGRQRRYIITMSVRTVSFILFVALWNVSRPLAWIALTLALLLPYVAVVIANAGRENAPKLPSTFIHPPVQPMLGHGEDEAGRRHRFRPAVGHGGPQGLAGRAATSCLSQ
ncbi:DUF3099 domain-containing protein [Actinacidiphila soli]|uniref:DUF3099 domain-containing protein n=1 Tax=Actinacidiphila soli TaxID=2487275 RepID=UPI000FCC08A1|nr:DUF3099 domain-containing protein [Actinacidiphila soli]